MKSATIIAGMIMATLTSPASANPEKDAVRAVIKAVKQGEDLDAAFPGAITAREIASLQRVSKCAALSTMKQKGGYYTVVWDCGSTGSLGMKVVVTDNKVTSVSTMEIERRPNIGRR